MKMKNWQITGAVFSLILGTLLHFTYQWSGKNMLVGYVSAVNESSWEHLKLLVTPVLLFSIVEFFAYGKNLPNFVPVKVLSILLGMFVTLALFYTYTGIVGQNYLPADISTFVAGVLFSYYFSYRLLQTDRLSSCTAVILGWVALAALVVSFIWFTSSPPQIALFRDPVSGGFGNS